MRYLFKYFNFIMFAVCVGAFIASEYVNAPWLLGLGIIALGLAGSLEGLEAIWHGEYIEIDGETGEVASFHGLSARLLAFSLLVPALVGVLLGLIVCLEWKIGPFMKNHWQALLGVAGLWLASRGGVLMLGSDECREESLMRRMITGLPLIGCVLCIAGLIVAVFAFFGINPLFLLP